MIRWHFCAALLLCSKVFDLKTLWRVFARMDWDVSETRDFVLSMGKSPIPALPSLKNKKCLSLHLGKVASWALVFTVAEVVNAVALNLISIFASDGY